MSFYDRYILPELISLVCDRVQFREQRQSILPQASGVVLDIGIGSGTNLPFYNADNIKHLYGLEPSARLRNKTRALSGKINRSVELLDNVAEDIPLDDNSIDSVVITFTMCSIEHIGPALQEARRVLKPSGQLLFCEHGLAPDHSVQKWQNRLNPIWKKMAGGCHLNRDITGLLETSGFTLSMNEQQYMKGPRAFSFIYKGRAKPA